MSDYEIIKYILNDINEDLDDEEKVHLLLNKTVSENNECKDCLLYTSPSPRDA